MDKNSLFVYTFIIISVMMTGMSLWTIKSSKELIKVSEQYNEIQIELDRFKTFDDSLAGSDDFLKRLLDTVRTVTELKEVKQKQGDELTRKIKNFRELYPDRRGMVMKHKILEGARNFLSIVFVMMAIPFFIHVFKRR